MSANGKFVFASSIATVLVAGVIAAPQQPQGLGHATALLGTVRGIDHAVIAVRDLDAAMRSYTEVLGFAVVGGGTLPGGLRNSSVPFGASYLELMSVDPSPAAPDDVLVRFLKDREGVHAFALNVSSAQKTADLLRARNFEVTGPEGSSFMPEGSKEVKTDAWQTVVITKPDVGPVFFIQYAPRMAKRKRPEHPNAAINLHSVWMAVKDLAAAVKVYEAVGLRSGRKLQMPELAAHGQEMEAGQGVVLFLQADSSTGPLASFVAQHGEGIIGLSIEVRDLQVARSFLRASTKQELDIYRGPFGQSIWVSPAFTHGVWMELFQKPDVKGQVSR